MKIEIEKDQLDELQTQVSTFGLLLSAMVRKHGTFNKHTDQYEYFVTLPMLQAISESQLFTTNEVNPKTKQSHTKVHLKLKEKNGG